MNFYRITKRSFYYYQIGYATYLAYPVSLFGYASFLYYNIPIINEIFQRFYFFVFLSFVILYPLGAFLGWFHFKKSPFYKAQQEIIAEANPYTVNTLPELNIPIWRLFRALAVDYGLTDVVEHIDGVIERSLANVK